MEQSRTMIRLIQPLFFVFTIALLPAPAGGDAPATDMADEAANPADDGETGETAGLDDYLHANQRAILHLEAWVEERIDSLALENRTYDPFGRLRDPSLEVDEPEPVEQVADTEPAPTGPSFAEMLGNVNPGIISPATGEFIWKGRTFRVGQTMSLSSQDTVRSARIVSVRHNEIVFEETETKERIRLRSGANQLPEGTERTSETSSQPPQGIQPVGSPSALPPIPVD